MSSRSAVDILSPEGVEFQHVSPKLAALRLGNAFALCGALCGAISGLVLIVDIPAQGATQGKSIAEAQGRELGGDMLKFDTLGGKDVHCASR